MRYPYYPYFPVVLDILHSRAAEQVLDAPCGTGWLGDNLHATARGSVELDGVGLWEFPEADGGYREVIEHDLETPLSLNRQYDAAVCCEAIHLVTNPGVLVESLRRALR
ncbi:class I SAM-dependent methyltransferase [Achromobacter xylosoxidans]